MDDVMEPMITSKHRFGLYGREDVCFHISSLLLVLGDVKVNYNLINNYIEPMITTKLLVRNGFWNSKPLPQQVLTF